MPFTRTNLLTLVEKIKHHRGLLASLPEALEAIEANARVIQRLAPHRIIAIVAREVEITARHMRLRHPAEPELDREERLDDRIRRLEATLRALA